MPVVKSARHLAGVVLLGGSVRPTVFNTAVGRSVLELPYCQGRTLLDEWRDEVAELSPGSNRQLPLRVLLDKSSEQSIANAVQPSHGVAVRFERDPSEWRGTGGVLRDISREYDDDNLLLVANAGQILLRPLTELIGLLSDLQSDVAVLAHRNGNPITLMLIRCGCLRGLPEIGYIDMKEQALPQLAKTYDVRVSTLNEIATLGLRTAKSYLAALRVIHAREKVRGIEEWQAAFGIREEGAIVDPSARLHDSVVLRGGVIGPGATVVGSVVCGGATVAKGTVAVEKLISRDGTAAAEDS